MTDSSNHKIGKISLKLQVSHQRGLHVLMDRLSVRVKDAVSKSLEGWWSEHPTADNIRINKVTLDLGTAPSHAIDRLLETELDTALRKSLQVNLSNDAAVAEHTRNDEHSSNALIYFLFHGSLPWNVSATNYKLQSCAEELILEIVPREWNHVLRYHRVRERLSALLSDPQFNRFLEYIAPDFCSNWKQVCAGAETALADWLRENKIKIELSALLRESLLELAIQDTIPIGRLGTFWVIEYQKQLPVQVLARFTKYIEHVLTTGVSNTHKGAELSVNHKAILKGLSAGSTIGTADNPVTDQHLNEFENPPTVNEYFIFNAGLAILWPGLRQLFTKCGLVQEDHFVDEDAQYRAVLFLHYLCSRQQNCFEYDLTFNKILCGLDAEHPFITQMTLKPQEMELADELVKEVLDKWTAVHKLSQQDLIANFFMRSGKLSRCENGWLLQVERKAWDVFLDKLPWGVGIIKLPWMNSMIYTEW